MVKSSGKGQSRAVSSKSKKGLSSRKRPSNAVTSKKSRSTAVISNERPGSSQADGRTVKILSAFPYGEYAILKQSEDKQIQ